MIRFKCLNRLTALREYTAIWKCVAYDSYVSVFLLKVVKCLPFSSRMQDVTTLKWVRRRTSIEGGTRGITVTSQDRRQSMGI